jgi:hypothetical protein
VARVCVLSRLIGHAATGNVSIACLALSSDGVINPVPPRGSTASDALVQVVITPTRTDEERQSRRAHVGALVAQPFPGRLLFASGMLVRSTRTHAEPPIAPAHAWRDVDEADGLLRVEEAIKLGQPSVMSVVGCRAAPDGKELTFVGGFWGVFRSDGNVWVKLDITTATITSLSIARAYGAIGKDDARLDVAVCTYGAGCLTSQLDPRSPKRNNTRMTPISVRL